MSRTHTARLDAPAIVEAAHALLRSYGLGDLSMRRVAKELGVQPGALYWHIASKQELIAHLAVRILAPLAQVAGTPAQHLRALHETVVSVRDGAETVTAAWSARPELLPHHGLLRALRERGESETRAQLIAETGSHYVLGFTQGLQTRLALAEADPATRVDADEWRARLSEGIALITGQDPAGRGSINDGPVDDGPADCTPLTQDSLDQDLSGQEPSES
ncbi:TetR/AcrR family transcriptional regulator [Sediminivirga luteola]|uniref:TetR/AcrR family transcriptional regulator n=1 Tax=Sediminivirga luteola TaxID=1774748 RepID=UPI001F56584F|nr:TetR/AcrR family transcriptional regulator [Sediminivirga luteola]MCI2265524.1 TetR/AcrR family transcriptional regulator [Sediminivirga luteola]